MNYEHRKAWIEQGIQTLDLLFPIDVAAYTVMSNNFNIVLHVDQDRIDQWDDRVIIDR